MYNLRDLTLKALVWSITSQFAQQIIRFIISVILARLLTPRDFGIIAMVFVFTGFAGLFAECGFSAAIIQKPNVEERHLSSVFWINLVTGVFLFAVTFLSAPLIAKFYKLPQLRPLTILISINFIISSLTIVQKAILSRALKFKKLAIINFINLVVTGIFAITLAIMGMGVWTLAWQMLVSTIIGFLLIWLFSDWKPKFYFDKIAVKELMNFSANLLGFNFLNYWVRNTDDLLIGKFFGSADLGIYMRAYSTMLMPLNQISNTIGRVMFPALSLIQNDKRRVKKIYLRAIAVIALVTFPMMLGLFVTADSFVIALFGHQWIKVIPVLKVMCLLGLVQPLVSTLGWIYTSQGRTDLFLRWGFGAGFLLILSILIGIWIGSILSVAICYTLMSGLVLVYPAFALPGKLIKMKFSEVVNNLTGILGCAAFMAACTYFLGIFIPDVWPPWLNLLIQIPSGIVIYFILIHFFKLKAYLEISELFHNWIKKQSIKKLS